MEWKFNTEISNIPENLFSFFGENLKNFILNKKSHQNL